jgi:hypothetical protein
MHTILSQKVGRKAAPKARAQEPAAAATEE